MAHSYSHLFKIPTMFRFTVYGPWGGQIWHYLNLLSNSNGEPIDVYNHGEMSRDFTYIDDLVDGMRLLIDVPENCSGIKDKYTRKYISGCPLSSVKYW